MRPGGCGRHATTTGVVARVAAGRGGLGCLRALEQMGWDLGRGRPLLLGHLVTGGGRVASAAGVRLLGFGLGAGLLGSLAKMLGDFSHIVSFTGLERSRDAAVLAHPPEVDRHQDDEHEREHQDVEHVPT